MATKFKKGLIFGKFLPPHDGHLWLIEKGLERCEHVIVLVCALDPIRYEDTTIQRERIPGYLRAHWLKKHFRGKPVEVVLTNIDNPQTPDDHALFWDIWTSTLRLWAKGVDVIVTGENYGDELSSRLNLEHVKVDGHRLTYPVSGRDLLRNPMDFYQYMNDDVSAYFTKKIAFVGPESVGKSVMVTKMAKYFGIPKVDEYGREYVEKWGVDKLAPESFSAINSMHRHNIHQACRGSKLVLCDTESITTHLWCERYCGVGSTPEDVLRNAYEEVFDHYFVLSADVEWDDDGVRKFGSQIEREKYFDDLMKILELKKASYTEVYASDFRGREGTVRSKLGELFGKYPDGSQN